MASFLNRLQHAWNAFMNKDPTAFSPRIGEGYYYRPDRPRFSRGNERSIVTAILNRISLDAASINVRHVRLDDNNRYLEDIDSGLNNCLSLDANTDQTGRAFIQDVVMSMLDEGSVAIVPVETTVNPNTGSFDILALRTGRITQWYPEHIRASVYNRLTGRREEVTLPKKSVAIVENPFFAVMNEPNSTLQRLIRKLAMLDVMDERISSGKLDLIIQLPYTVKTQLRQNQAESRREDLERQLAGSKYGIGYIDGTEHITQLNRPVENNLMTQIQYLTELLFSQLGITQEIMDGSANETTMNNYYTRIIEPILAAIIDEMRRSFLTKTARTQRQSIMFFRDPFKLMPTSSVAEIADKFTRNEIMTSNEIRQIVGMKPSDDPNADELRNKNLSQSSEAIAVKEKTGEEQLSSEESVEKTLKRLLEESNNRTI